MVFSSMAASDLMDSLFISASRVLKLKGSAIFETFPFGLLNAKEIIGRFLSLDSVAGDDNTESLLIFNKPHCDGDFPLLRLLVVAFGETQLFAVNISGRLDSCKDRHNHYFYASSQIMLQNT